MAADTSKELNVTFKEEMLKRAKETDILLKKAISAVKEFVEVYKENIDGNFDIGD